MIDKSDSAIFNQIKPFIGPGNPSILEIGCGDGRISRYLVNKTDHLTGIDPDADRIEKARTNAPQGRFLPAPEKCCHFLTTPLTW